MYCMYSAHPPFLWEKVVQQTTRQTSSFSRKAGTNFLSAKKSPFHELCIRIEEKGKGDIKKFFLPLPLTGRPTGFGETKCRLHFPKIKSTFCSQILHRNIDSIERRSSSSCSASTVAPSTAGVRSGSFDAVFHLPVYAC